MLRSESAFGKSIFEESSNDLTGRFGQKLNIYENSNTGFV